jgi:tRNA pseudouridine55 synthase
MTRRRKGHPVHGWIVLDKPAGKTSTQALGAVRRILDAGKAGHAGTLDPLATGVLPIALGEATKTIPFVQDGRKAYTFTVTWGEARDTDDAAGAVIATSAMRPSPAAVAAALPRFVGTLSQTPPAYSAIKVAGQRAYDLARQGKAVVLSARPVVIDHLALLESGPECATLAVECGKGTYVRVLARELAEALGTVGHVSALRRTRVGPWAAGQAISLDRLGELVLSAAPEAYLHPVAAALADIPALALTETEAQRLRAGQAIRVAAFEGPPGEVCATANGLPIAVARVADGELRPVRVFNW